MAWEPGGWACPACGHTGWGPEKLPHGAPQAGELCRAGHVLSSLQRDPKSWSPTNGYLSSWLHFLGNTLLVRQHESPGCDLNSQRIRGWSPGCPGAVAVHAAEEHPVSSPFASWAQRVCVFSAQ